MRTQLNQMIILANTLTELCKIAIDKDHRGHIRLYGYTNFDNVDLFVLSENGDEEVKVYFAKEDRETTSVTVNNISINTYCEEIQIRFSTTKDDLIRCIQLLKLMIKHVKKHLKDKIKNIG